MQVLTPHPSATTVACSPSTYVVAGKQTTCTATVTDTAGVGKSMPTGTISLSSSGSGSFSGAGKCTLTESSSGGATCSLTYTPTATPATPVRSDIITAAYGGDSLHTPSSGTAAEQVLSITLLSSGSFVIGDQSAKVGAAVTFWGAKWWKLNSLSGGTAPSSFTGFASSTPQPTPLRRSVDKRDEPQASELGTGPHGGHSLELDHRIGGKRSPATRRRF